MGLKAGAEFDRFVAENYQPVLRALTVAFGDADAASDHTQEAFARALVQWKRVATMDRPVAWVYVVGINAGRRSLKKDARHRKEQFQASATADPAGSVVTVLTLEAALDSLPPRQRHAVVLRHLAGLSTSEVAAAMGCAEGTVKSTLHAALRALRVELEGEDDDER